MRAALYARVSTNDRQTLDLEVEAMRSVIKGVPGRPPGG